MNDEYNNNQPYMGSNDNHKDDYSDNSINQSNDTSYNSSLSQNNDQSYNSSLNQSNDQSYDSSLSQSKDPSYDNSLSQSNDPGYYSSLNRNEDKSNDSSLNQNENQSFDNNYTTGDYNTNVNKNQAETQTDSSNPHVIYSTPEVNEDKKPKKKRKFGVFKLTAAALAFGLIAGAGFQGYYTIANMTGNTSETSSKNDAKVVAKDTDSGDTVVASTKSSSGSVVTDVSDVVDNVMPSIVAINCKITTTASDFFGQQYSQESEGSGSGIIIGENDSKLLIVTNNHVINGATSVEVVFANDKTATAEIKGADANADLAVLSVNMSDLSDATLKAIKVATLGDSDKVEAGDMAIAIGNALGYGQSVTVGYISAVNREVTVEDKTMTLLQTDAAINPGNSGGALLNTKGEVIGINSVKYASEEVEGMGYSIPISSAIPMINELMNREAVSAGEQGYLGINANSAQNVTKEYSERFNMPVGVYVNEVIAKSPAAKAGLKQGDIITGVDDVSVSTIDDLVNVLSYKKSGQTINLKIQVKSSGAYVEKTLKVTLGSKN